MSAQNPIGTTGAEWSAIVGRNGTNEFAASFAANPVLEASVLSGPCVGVDAIASFFGATTSGMYESLAFTNETVDARKTYLEWEGKAFGKDVGGTTILTRDEAGLIQSIRLYHRPVQMVVQFAQELARRLTGKFGPGPFNTFETARGIHDDSCNTHETACTQFVQAGDIRFAYRRLGRRGGLPLLFVNYFAANMDDWDPKLTNGFATEHDVILFDNAGVANSTGETPSTVTAMTKGCVDFCRALDLKRLNVVGFSLGGMIAQQLCFEYPDMVRRIVLLGTGPRGGEGMTFTELSLDELGDPVALLMTSFFTSSEASRAAGHAYLERLKLRAAERDLPVSMKSAGAQLDAIREWGAVPSSDRYAMLRKIHQRSLIVHGSNDIVVIPINAFLLEQHLPNAQLVMYPDASHGAASQHADVFLEHAQIFLNA
jgi:pimeloyl-ACP methyl ester carboxylesterase